ncbi:hypothetical protein BGZ68_002991 [Mortierella alpina]|nr:hypothetical protein BGZ68_002991 [Mortierella alpina]
MLLVTMTNDFFEFVYDCMLFEYVGFGPVKGTAIYLAEFIRAFAYIAKLYALNSTEFNVQQNAFHKYLGLQGYTRLIEDDIPKIHPLFPAETTKVHPPGQDPYLSIPALPQAQRELFLWRYARQVPTRYQDDIALLIQKLRRDVWFSYGNGKGNVKIYRRAHNQTKINRQLGTPKAEKNALPRQATIGVMIAQTMETVSALESRLSLLSLLDGMVDSMGTQMASINTLMIALQKATVSTPMRTAQILQFIKTLQSFLRTQFSAPGLQLHITGSYANGLSALTSDVDVTLTGPTEEIDVRQLADKLLRHYEYYEKVFAIADARVPIVTFWYRPWDISCDISINQELSIQNSKLVKTYEAIDPRMQTIWFSLKHLAKEYDILSAKDGFLSSYALTMMLITYLQTRTPPVLPRLQQQPVHKMPLEFIEGINCSFDPCWRPHGEVARRNKASSGDLLVGLLRYFGHQFDYATMEVNPRLGQFRPQVNNSGRGGTYHGGLKRGGFWVMDPFLIDRNVAGMCRGHSVEIIKRAFQRMHQTVIEHPTQALGVPKIITVRV